MATPSSGGEGPWCKCNMVPGLMIWLTCQQPCMLLPATDTASET
jgi:hypothetical protein